MGSVLKRHGNVEHVLGPELVTDLITEGTAVNIGGSLEEKEGYYALRDLKRKIYLHLDVLKDKTLYDEAFAVSGMTENELFKIASSRKIVKNFSTVGEEKQFYDEIVVLPTEDAKIRFSELCGKNHKETLHWLKYEPKERTFLWKESSGDTGNLQNSVDLERTHGDKRIIGHFMKHSRRQEVRDKSIWDLGERTVLVVAEPGMGKSSTITEVARRTKSADPTSWVVRINWNDQCRKLQEINAETFNFDSLVEFLCSTAFPESKYSGIERSLLKEALKNIGNVS